MASEAFHSFPTYKYFHISLFAWCGSKRYMMADEKLFLDAIEKWFAQFIFWIYSSTPECLSFSCCKPACEVMVGEVGSPWTIMGNRCFLRCREGLTCFTYQFMVWQAVLSWSWSTNCTHIALFSWLVWAAQMVVGWFEGGNQKRVVQKRTTGEINQLRIEGPSAVGSPCLWDLHGLLGLVDLVVMNLDLKKQ